MTFRPPPPAAPAGHTLLLYRSEDHRGTTLAAWSAAGLSSGEKVILGGLSFLATRALLRELARRGFTAEDALASGQLQLASDGDFFAVGGQESVVAAALDEGYPGVRMSGHGDQRLSSSDPGRYEAAEAGTDRLCERYPLSTLCLYGMDGQTQRDAVLAVAQHPIVIDDSFALSTRVADPDAPPGGGRLVLAELAGELDLSNVPALLAGVTRAASLAGACGNVHLDVSGLRFLGVAGARSLLLGTEALRSSGGVLRISGADQHVDTVIRLFGFSELPGIELATDW